MLNIMDLSASVPLVKTLKLFLTLVQVIYGFQVHNVIGFPFLAGYITDIMKANQAPTKPMVLHSPSNMEVDQ